MSGQRTFKKLGLLGGFAAVVSACAQQAPATLVNGPQSQSGFVRMLDRVQDTMHDIAYAPTTPRAGTTQTASAKPAVKTTALASTAMPSGRIAEESLASIEPAAGPSVQKVTTGFNQTQKIAQPRTSEMVSHEVVASDTVFKLARTYNTSASAILKENNLASVADLKVGQVLSITTETKPQVSAWEDVRKALSSETAANSFTPQGQGLEQASARVREAVEQAEQTHAMLEPAAGPSVEYVNHTVEPKETIYRISLKYKVSILDIMAANDFSEPQDLKADAVIRVPMKTESTRVAVAERSGIEPSAGAPVQVAMLHNAPLGLGAKDDLDTRAARQEALKAEVAEALPVRKTVELVRDEVREAESKRGYIDPVAARSKGPVWPVKGQVVRRFGDDGSGVARTGINIAVPKGTPVLASDSGTVLYADNGLKIYGNLVLVRHDNGMVSAYAHNSYLLVKKGERVKKGQVVSLSGASGNVESPQLHFELRQHASAVDPLRVLPRIASN